jgi:hypothetical protein
MDYFGIVQSFESYTLIKGHGSVDFVWSLLLSSGGKPNER